MYLMFIYRKPLQTKFSAAPFSFSIIPRHIIKFSTRAMSTSNQARPLKEEIEALLNKYTACDIADVLLKLKVPGAGFLPDLKPAFNSASVSINKITIAPLSTVVFAAKNSTDLSNYPAANIPADKHWVDLTVPDSIVVISQPEGQKNAVLGGIMALRAQVLGAKGVIVSGRVRDIDELEATGIPVSFLVCLPHPETLVEPGMLPFTIHHDRSQLFSFRSFRSFPKFTDDFYRFGPAAHRLLALVLNLNLTQFKYH